MKNVLILSAAFLALFIAGELMFRLGNIKPELTRKTVHFGSGIITLLFPLLLESHWHVLILCGSFAVILVTSLQFGFLPSINNIGRRSFGSALYPLAVYVSFLFYVFYSPYNEGDPALFYIPVLLLAVCDPIAALVGNKWHYGSYSMGNEKKCLTGNIAFFISAFVISLFVLAGVASNQFPLSKTVVLAVTLGLGCAIAEGVSRKGSDNIFIPASAILILYMLF